MAKSYLLMLLAFGLSNAQTVTIPDANFKNRLLHTNCASFEDGAPANSFNAPVDTNSDGEIQLSEAIAVKGLRVNTSIMTTTNDILSLEGISNFSNLPYLNCLGNQIAALDVTMMPDLFELNCSYNHLATLDFSGLPQLELVNANRNDITVMPLDDLPVLGSLQANLNLLDALDATGLPALEILNVESNQLATLQIHDMPALREVRAFNNLLTAVDLSGLTALRVLGFGQNLFTGFDLSPLTGLEEFDISSNAIAAIDLTGHTNLNLLYIGNTLVSEIDCSTTGIRYLKCAFNPNLTAINVKNGAISVSDGSTSDIAFVIAEVPLLASICIDDDAAERYSVLITDYNTTGNVTVYTGQDCLTEVTMATTSFEKTQSISIYPNPVNEKLTIETNGNAIESVSVFNSLGQKIGDSAVDSATKTVNVSALSEGTYFLKLTTASGQETKRFIKL